MKSAIASPPAAKPGLPLWLRLLATLAWLFLTGFAAFGFLATLEPNPWWFVWPWRLAYAALGFASLTGLAMLWRRGKQTR